MSNVSTRISSEELAFILTLNQVANAIGLYVIPAICVAGFFLNLTNLILLLRSNLNRLNTTCYECICSKSITDIVLCFFGALNLNYGCKCLLYSEVGREWSGSYSYWYISFLVYIEVPCLRISLLASAYSALAVIINRFRVLCNKTTTYSLTKKGRIFQFYFFAALPCVPAFFMLEPIQSGESWYAALTEFSKTNTFKIYIICITLLESVIPIALLIIFTLITRAKFKQRFRRRQDAGGMVNARERINREDFQFSRLVLVIMTIFITSRSIDMIGALLLRFQVFIFYETDFKRDAIIYLVRQLTLLVLFIAHAFNSLVYYAMNSKLKQILPFGRRSEA